MKKTLSIIFLLLVSFITAQAQYCVPDPGTDGCDDGDLIDNFILFGENGTSIINLNSGCSANAYADLTAQSVSMGQGATYTAMISTDFFPDDNVAIWIDFNDNTTFESSELVASGMDISLAGTPVSIVIPGTAALGSHRMRVALRYDILPADMNPCNVGTTLEASDFGEAHDYTVNIVPPPTCAAPTNLVASGMTQTSVNLTWNGSAPNYSIEYGPVGFVPGTGTYSTSGTNSATINTLTSATNYSVYVRALCSGTDSSSTVSVNFATTCGAQNIPYTENFDAVTTPEIPICMTVEDVNADANTWFTADFIAQSQPNSLFYGSDGFNDANEWIFTPGLNVTAGTTYTVSFSYMTSGDPEALEVKAGTSAASTAMGTTAYFNNAMLTNTTFQTSSFNYTATTTGVIYFGWHLFSFANFGGIILDDINITTTTTSNCDTSLTLTTSAVTANSATFTWSAVTGANGYQYVLDQTPTPPTGAGTPTNLLTYTDNSLTPNTTYYFHLRTACGTNFSTWKTVSFTTEPLGVTDVNARNANVKIYPNPVSNIAYIELSNVTGNATLQLTDVSGKVLQVVRVTDRKAQIDMGQMASGIYFVRYSDEQGQKLVKLIKE